MKTYRRKERKITNIIKNPRALAVVGLLLLLVSIPITVSTINQQRQTRSSAAASAIATLTNFPQTVTTGQKFSVDVNVDPAGHKISFIKLDITYDSSILSVGSDGITTTSAIPIILDGPTFQQCSGGVCSMSIAIAVGPDPKNAISSPTKIAVLNFTPIAPTLQGPTDIMFANDNQMLSLTTTDQPNENVLVNPTSKATLSVTGSAINTPTPVPGTSPSPTLLTPSPNPTNPGTTASITVALPGSGIDGGNQSPHHTQRTAYVTLVDAANHAYRAVDILTYDQQLTTDQLSVVAFFDNAKFNLGQIPDGTYDVYVKVDQYLQAKIGTAVSIKQSDPLTVFPRVQLIIGDIAPIPGKNGEPYGDNVLDIQDYNVFISCFGLKATTRNCPNPLGADLNDDGVIDGTDYNLLLIGIGQSMGFNGVPTPTPRTFTRPTP